MRRNAAAWLAVAVAAVLAGAIAFKAARRRSSEAPDVARVELARAVALSKYEELAALPPGAAELRLEDGVSEAVHEEEERTALLSPAPGFDPPRLLVRWTVESLPPARAAEGRLRRVTITVRDAAPRRPPPGVERAAAGREALARLVFVAGAAP